MMFEFLQVITFVLSIVLNGNLLFMSDGYCYDGSYNSSCANYGLRIKDPFWIPSKYSTGCEGYPEFGVKCEGEKPLMNISNHFYYVQDIEENSTPLLFSNSNSNSITLMDVDIDGEECPRPRHNLSLQYQPFLHYVISEKLKLTVFYNCTIAPTAGVGVHVQELPCLEYSNNNKTRRSYAFQPNYTKVVHESSFEKSVDVITEGFFHEWYNYCEESVDVHVTLDSASNLAKALQQPFSLRWSRPVDCDDCRYSGGECSANHTPGGSFRCQCTDGTTVENDLCHGMMILLLATFFFFGITLTCLFFV